MSENTDNENPTNGEDAETGGSGGPNPNIV